ncbi:MAG: hypothetical protein H0V70_06920 [Ktedonobacteraceae bacterium]|nr:hypothetical protein [Ktedonobacteraceae bacterium]
MAASNNAVPDNVQVASSDDSASPVPMQSIQTASDSQLFVLLAEAYSQEVKDKGSEWIAIPYLGSSLKKLSPAFKAKDYGKKDLPTLIQSYPELFETRKQTQGKARHVEVRLRT